MTDSVIDSPMTFRRSLLAVLGLALVLMLSALDQTVIGNAMPYIVADLGNFDLYAWVATSYLLTSIITVPIFGRLGDYYGRKYFVLAATLLFTLSSALCSFAGSMSMLILWRAVQGIGGGMLVGTAFACIPELFPDTRQRLRWQILFSTAFSIVNALGPTLGGILTEQYGWRSVFYLNLPLGLLALVVSWRYLPYFKPQKKAAIRLDWLGALLIMCVLGSLQLLAEFLPSNGSAFTLIALMLACGLSSAILLFQQRRAHSPILPPPLFAIGPMRQLFIISALIGAVLFTLLYFMPLLFQGGYGYSPKQAAWLITPMGVSITVSAIINGRIVTRMRNPMRLPQMGFLVAASACALLALLGNRGSFGVLLALMMMSGVGIGFILLNVTLFTQTLAPREFLGISTALSQSLRLVGGLLGTALTGAGVTKWYSVHVTGTLQAADNIPLPPTVIQHFANPQVLLLPLSADFSRYYPLARSAMVNAIDIGLAACALLALLAFWQSTRLPLIQFPGISPRSGKKPTLLE
ncbi:MFS transporter [Rahnella sp. SAP-1]|jgi:EmrB/QacA subfamily drug resistance transporter|uniref:MFS transporter n=1 Tax=Rouxiella aceris TaxID=2703884 RepID=A0A848MKS6_9GAMM|nr:MFS transporter [Rouxiella aceris]NMP26804.1 MFS transporter [Rouxiella aceris]